MDVPEQAVLGNNRMLVTIGKHGELRYLFWPTIDYPQHIKGSLPGLFYSFNGKNRFDWLTDDPWVKKQEYNSETNILQTIFSCNNPNINVKLTDLVLPTKDVLLRKFEFENHTDKDIFLRFYYYNDLALSESPIDDAAYYVSDLDSILHYKRDFYFAYSGTLKSSGHQCGVHGEYSDSFQNVYDYNLHGSSLTLYDGSRDVNSCLSWDIEDLKKGENKTLSIFIAMAQYENEVVKVLKNCKAESIEKQIDSTSDFWRNWIKQYQAKDDKWKTSIRRSLLTLKLLTAKEHGAIIAAPCMDPEYRFCWPRDATYVAYAFDRCGFTEEAKRFYKWCAKAQEIEGGLYQRYYIGTKLRGPCWSSQIDEIATVLWGIEKHFEITNDKRFLRSLWKNISKASEFLIHRITESKGFVETVGLWEEKFGSHTYSNAAIYAGLRAVNNISKTLGNKINEDLVDILKKFKENLLESSWDPHLGRFIKTSKPRDENIDISLLSLSYPFDILPANDERIIKTAKAIDSAFYFNVKGIGRYPFDKYYGGNPWILTTLWLALYYIKAGNLDRAKDLINWAWSNATSLGLLPEQIDKETGKPVSAIPLAWSHAFFVLSVLDLKDKDQR